MHTRTTTVALLLLVLTSCSQQDQYTHEAECTNGTDTVIMQYIAESDDGSEMDKELTMATIADGINSREDVIGTWSCK